jgi:O-antigen/teichoic acid export membrane protein
MTYSTSATPSVPPAGEMAAADPADSESALSSVRGAATVFSDYASVLGARLGSALLSLISVMITTRLLAPSGYGNVAYITVIATLVFTITSAWTSTAVSRYGREELERSGSMNVVTWDRIALTAPLLAASIAIVAVLKAAGALPANFGWDYVALALASGVLLITAEHMIYLVEAAGRMKLSALGMLLRQGLVVGALAVIYATGASRSVVLIVLISLASSLGLTLVLTGVTWRVGVWPPRVDRALLRRMLLFSAPLIAFTVSQYVIRSVDLVVIRANGTTADVGVYAVAYQGYSVLQGLAAASGPVLTPLFVSLKMADKGSLLQRYVDRVVPQMAFLTGALAGFLAPLVVPLVPVVFGKGFGGAANPSVVLLTAQLFFFVASLTAPVLVLYERSGAIAAINVAAAAINVVGDILLIGVLGMGIVGAAISTSLALACICVGYLVTSKRLVGSQAMPDLALLAPLAVGVSLAIVLPDSALAVASAMLAALAVSVAVVFVLRPFEAADAEIIGRLDIPGPIKSRVLRGLALVSR